MSIKDLLPNLFVNREPPAHLPRSSQDGPLVISVEVLEAIESGKMMAEKFQGWKGDILWTSGAMLWLASKDLI